MFLYSRTGCNVKRICWISNKFYLLQTVFVFLDILLGFFNTVHPRYLDFAFWLASLTNQLKLILNRAVLLVVMVTSHEPS